jgi:tetratricopeptide (TPR) repeat protein
MGVVVGFFFKKLGTDMKIIFDDGQIIEKPLTLTAIANGMFCGGGFKAAPLARLNDGLLDICSIDKVSKTSFIQLVGSYKAGTYLENEKGEDHYEDIKNIIETLPYMYPYMLQDRMRLSASHIRGEEGMKEAKDLKIIEWQEFFIACATVGQRYFEEGDYENAMLSYRESVDVIERFMIPDKKGYEAYPIGGTHANHAITILEIAACLFRLGRTDGIDAEIERAKRIYFDAYETIEVRDYDGNMREMLAYFTKEYNKLQLNEYRPLDLSEFEGRLKEPKERN